MHINNQIEFPAVEQGAHFLEIRPFPSGAHLFKFFFIKIEHLVNDGRVRHKIAELRVHQPGQPGFGKPFPQRRHSRQRVQNVTQRAHFDNKDVFIVLVFDIHALQLTPSLKSQIYN